MEVAISKSTSVFISNVRAICRDRNINQSALAAMCGMKQPQISALFAGKNEPVLSTVEKIATGLDIPVHLALDPDCQEKILELA